MSVLIGFVIGYLVGSLSGLVAISLLVAGARADECRKCALRRKVETTPGV
jgi:hypothetical protein